MISLEQIHTLENKVHSAVSRIHALSDENATLKSRLENYEERIAELETLVSAFKADQEEIEAGIVSALKHLDELEDTVAEPPEAPAARIAEAETQPTPNDGPAEPQRPVPSEPGEPDVLPPEELRSQRSDDEPTEENTTPDEDESPELDIF